MAQFTGTPAYLQIARDLRQGIASGVLAPGARVPSEAELMRQYAVSRTVAKMAIQVLRNEGHIVSHQGKGSFVRARPARRRVTRDRRVHRDEIGYYFDPAAKTWKATATPRILWLPAPDDIADILQATPGEAVLVRDRRMGEPGGPTLQLATSYLPGWLVRGTRLEQPDTGHGGIYDRMEEMGHLLHWRERVTARMPTPDEMVALNLPEGVPVLRIVRTTLNQKQVALEVNDTRLSADEFEIAYDLERAPEARRPGTRPRRGSAGGGH